MPKNSLVPQAPHPAASSATAHDQPVRKRKHRAGKKRKNRRKSFAIPHDDEHDDDNAAAASRDSFYSVHGGNLSNTSIESQELLDHRAHLPLRLRRGSTMGLQSKLRSVLLGDASDDETHPGDEGAPLLSSSLAFKRSETLPYGTSRDRSRHDSGLSPSRALLGSYDNYNVNYPPSIPGSPRRGPTDHLEMSFGDAMLRDELRDGSPHAGSMDDSGRSGSLPETDHMDTARRHTIAGLQADADVCFPGPGMSDIADDEMRIQEGGQSRAARRRRKWPDLAILEEWSRLEREDKSEGGRVKRITEPQLVNGRLRPTHKGWYRAEEDAPYRFTYFNEEFPSTIHSQTISELVQPGAGNSFRELFVPDPRLLVDDSESEDSGDEPSPGTIHLHHIISGQDRDSKVSTRNSSITPNISQETTISNHQEIPKERPMSPLQLDADPAAPPEAGARTPVQVKSPISVKPPQITPEHIHQQQLLEKAPRYGDRPVWWLDILNPTELEMKVISKAFGIHPLTAEDIIMQEAREKVELFNKYYFVNYRTFDQDVRSETYLEPVNMYAVVFREGVISFHFAMTPHAANVRRRIRQLKDYLILSSDWISYAIIDDITDVFGPLIQSIEDEVDEIDDAILQLHSGEDRSKERSKERSRAPSTLMDDAASHCSSRSDAPAESGRDMLRRVGDCRKRVMSLYRLLGNKADVIKGFAKRCNERWEVAPRSEIGLYLGDIYDHISTMSSNLSHYEKILARSHGNYLAQINIRMNERQEQTADVLGKLTVLGTIVLPMNIITGLWGMNVWVPGQEHEGNLMWFAVITAGLFMFGAACYLIAKRVYKIV